MPEFSESAFLTRPRKVTHWWHVQQARKWLVFDQGRHLDSSLVYAAFELRLAAERLLFELLVLSKDDVLTPEDVERCRSTSGLLAVWREFDPEYRKTLRFSQLLASIAPDMPEVAFVEPGKLDRMIRDLSEYCHMQLEPSETFESHDRQFQERGFELLERILDDFQAWRAEIKYGVIKRESLPEPLRHIYDQYLRDEIDEDSVQRRIQLISPVLEMQRIVRAMELP